MGRAVKVIPCLDLCGGRVVKGVNFVGLKDVGDPAEIAAAYQSQGADELVFLDINATYENRSTMLEVIARAAKNIRIPLTVGGGLRTIKDIKAVLDAGASKASIGSAGVLNPDFIREAADAFGSDKIVCAIDAKLDNGKYHVFISGGRTKTQYAAAEFAGLAEKNGAGEILLTSMDRDGALNGFDLRLLAAVRGAIKIPLTASGGAGKPEDFKDAAEAGADAVLAASMFHFGTITVGELKAYLSQNGFNV